MSKCKLLEHIINFRITVNGKRLQGHSFLSYPSFTTSLIFQPYFAQYFGIRH